MRSGITSGIDVFFGNGTYGRIPEKGSMILVEYVVSDGIGGNMSMDYVKKSQETNRAYNEVAQKFQGMTVGYGQNMSGQTYGVQGASLDLFA